MAYHREVFRALTSPHWLSFTRARRQAYPLLWMLFVALALAGALVPLSESLAQVSGGATLTVLRGTVVVVRSDGSALQPARSGLSLGVGDQVATLGGAGALLTFFEGSEVELGAETTLVIRDLSTQGRATSITLENVLGTSLHRVVTLSDPGSSYRVESGSSVALVRGTEFAVHTDPSGDVTTALLSCSTPSRATPVAGAVGPTATPTARPTQQCLEFPRAGMFLNPGDKVTATARGDILSDRFSVRESIWDAVTSPANGRAPGTDNEGLSTGSRSISQHTSANREDPDRDPPSPTATPTETATPSVTQHVPSAPGSSPTSTATPGPAVPTATSTLTPTVTPTSGPGADNRLYVSSDTTHVIQVFDRTTNALVQTITLNPTGLEPVELALNPAGTRLYSVNRSSNNVSVIDTATNAVIATIGVGSQPRGIAITPDGAFAYVSNSGAATVSVLNLTTNTVIGSIGVGTNPTLVAMRPDGARAYVANGGGSVSEINTATNAVVGTATVFNTPFGVAVRTDGQRLYVSRLGFNAVNVIDTATLFTVTSITVGNGPVGIAPNPSGGSVIVANQSSNTVSVINTASNTVAATIPVGSTPGQVAFSADGSRAYVSNQLSDSVSIINTATNTVIGTISTADFPIGIVAR